MTDRPTATHGCRRPRPAGVRGRGGFTLVELLIVVVILSILAAVAIPRLNSERTEAVVSALMANVNLVAMTLEYQRHHDDADKWPAAIDPAWFASGRYPDHPDQPAGVAQIETVRVAADAHPASKVLSSASAGAYWYNVANGAFRARVVDQGSSPATLEMYNRVNQSSLGSLSDRISGEAAPADGVSGGARPQG